MEKTPKHCCLDYPNSQRAREGVWWDKHSSNRDVHVEHTKGMEAHKYFRKSCCHRIECFVANFLAAFIWRRPLISTTLTTPTHRRLERVSDEKSTQVIVWMINKWRVKINQGEVYNIRNLRGIGGRGGGEEIERERLLQSENRLVIKLIRNIQKLISSNHADDGSL